MNPDIKQPLKHGNKFQFTVLIEPETFTKIEKNRGYIPRSVYVGEIIRKTLSGEKRSVELL